MREQVFENTKERRVLISMIFDKAMLGNIAALPREQVCLNSPWANLLAHWSLKHYDRFQKAPGKNIIHYFEEWKDEKADKTSADLAERFLRDVNDHAKKMGEGRFNSDLETDLAKKLFTEAALNKLRENIEGDLDTGHVDKAVERVTSFSKIEIATNPGIDLFTDREAVRRMCSAESTEAMFSYPGPIGEFFHNAIEREALLAFAGRQKIGKTHWLADFALRAASNRLRVAFFEIGDMSESEISQLLLVRLARHPIRTHKKDQWPLTVKIPTDIRKEIGSNEYEIDYKEKTFAKPLSESDAWKYCQKFQTDKLKSTKSFMRLSCHANLSLSVPAMESILDRWDLQGWPADVVVIDYADNFMPSDRRLEPREQVNVNWKRLKGLAQKRRCLVVTATQIKAAGFNKEVLEPSDFSEDNRKLSHVNGMIGINCSNLDKDMGVYRLNWIAKRKGYYTVNRCVYSAGCLALSNPCLVSTW